MRQEDDRARRRPGQVASNSPEPRLLAGGGVCVEGNPSATLWSHRGGTPRGPVPAWHVDTPRRRAPNMRDPATARPCVGCSSRRRHPEPRRCSRHTCQASGPARASRTRRRMPFSHRSGSEPFRSQEPRYVVVRQDQQLLPAQALDDGVGDVLGFDQPARGERRGARGASSIARSSIGVRTPCGQMHETRTPASPYSMGEPLGERDGRVLGDAVDGAEETCASRPGRGGGVDRDSPRRAGTISGSSARAAQTCAITFTRQASSQASSVGLGPAHRSGHAGVGDEHVDLVRSGPLARSISSRTLLSLPGVERDRGSRRPRRRSLSGSGELAVCDDDRARALLGDPAHERPPDAPRHPP